MLRGSRIAGRPFISVADAGEYGRAGGKRTLLVVDIDGHITITASGYDDHHAVLVLATWLTGLGRQWIFWNRSRRSRSRR